MIKRVDVTSSEADCGYSRLSVDRDHTKAGYEIQMDGAEGWAERMGHTIAHWYKDPNITAADENVRRDRYEEMLADVEAGMWKGIVVWRIDRLTRLSSEFERCLRAVRKNGGYIISTDERLDSRNPNDLIQMKLKVIMGDHDVQSTRSRIKANKSRRIKAGEYKGGGRRPYGFEGPIHDSAGRVTNTGRCGIIHVPDEVENLKDAARRVAWEGQSYLDVIHDWHDRTPAIYGATGAPWSIKTLETVLTSPRMIGKQEWTDPASGVSTLVEAVWEPVLDERTWNRLRSMKKKAAKVYNNKETYLLTNILRCGRCGGGLTGSQRTYLNDGKQLKAVRTYRCPSGAAYKARGNCGKLNVISDPVEKIVVAHVLVRAKRTRGISDAFVGGNEETYDLLEALEAKKAEAEEELEDLAKGYGKQEFSYKEWIAARSGIQDRLDGYESKMKALASRLAIPTPTGKDFLDLPAWFDKLSLRQQQALIKAHIEYVDVLPPGRSGRYFNPDRIKPKFAKLEEADGEG